MLRIAANGSAANGLLGDRLYVSGHDDEQQHEPMTWQSKLKILREIAHAIPISTLRSQDPSSTGTYNWKTSF